jgi:hypothetical protein
VPEVADKFLPVPRDARWLNPAEAQPGFVPHFAALERLRWWRRGLDPTKLTQPLRAPASVLSGCVAACRARLDGAEQCLALAKDAADFLMWAQEEAGSGVYPFPAARGVTTDPAFQAADRFLAEAEKAGRLGEVVRKGWVYADLQNGGLQFDNGECGVAMLELYEFTRDVRYLDSARWAAEWAIGQPMVPNWNYNSFSVYLLAKTAMVTGDSRYLEAAKTKALLGVIPGQLTEGAHAGRWLDAHNARPAYHYIMMRALAQLAAALPAADPDRPGIVAALRLGLRVRNSEIVSQGAPTKDKAVEAMLLVNGVFANDREFLRESLSVEALDALGRLVSSEALRGKNPLGPREWGAFLEWVVRRQPR